MSTKRSAIPSLILALLICLSPLPASAASPALDRVAQAGRLWGTVRYLHPYLLYRDVDWDAALIAALPRIEAAKSGEEYAAAVQGMLGALGDPVTRVVPPAAAIPEKPAPAAPPALTRRLADGTLVLDLGPASRALGARELMNEGNAAFREILREPAVLVDLRRGPVESGEDDMLPYALAELEGSLVSRPCRAPSQRFVQRSGFQTQDGASSGSYYEAFVTLSAQSFAPAVAGDPKRIVFAVDRWTRVPPVALALQSVGDARIVIESGALQEDAVVTTRRIDLGDGWSAQVRVSEILPQDGWPGLHADAVGDLATVAAELKKDGWGKPAASSSAAAPLPGPVFRPDNAYAEMLAPDRAHRQLAVIRAWNVIHYFYPYLHLLGDWDAVLPESLAAMETAESGRDYALAVMAMMAHVTDGHTGVYGHPEIPAYFGQARLPLAVRWIEGAAVVTAVGDAGQAAGIAPGDAILAVDGEAVPARIERLSRYVTASTRAALLNKLCGRYLLLGPAGPAVLSVQSPGGAAREVHLVRDSKAQIPAPPAGDAVRILPGNLGYVDLTQLTVPEVDGMFERLKGTRALILDMRGYPQSTAWSIAPRINTRRAKIGAQFRRPLVAALSEEEGSAGVFFAQPLPEPPPGKALYTAPVVMLIDDRAISQSEHSGLFYEAANGTTFIGTASAGANGDVTGFSLPGGLRVVFTGHDVRHADGRQLQKVGLTPDIEVAPTRAGVRAGKDEVLERAVAWVEERLKGERVQGR